MSRANGTLVHRFHRNLRNLWINYTEKGIDRNSHFLLHCGLKRSTQQQLRNSNRKMSICVSAKEFMLFKSYFRRQETAN